MNRYQKFSTAGGIKKINKTKPFARWVVFLLVLFWSAAPGLAQTRDFWLKTERKGTGFSNEHIVVRPLENGCFEYTSDTHIKMDVFGVKQDLILNGTFIVDVNLSPVSFEMYNKSRAKDVHVTGRYNNGIMHLTIKDQDSDVLQREVPFQNTYFAVVLADLILKREKEKAFKINVFDSMNLIVIGAQVEVTKSNAKQVESTVTHHLTQKFNVDRQKRTPQVELVELHILSYPTDAESAQNISYLDTANGYILMVKSKRSFPNVYKVAQAQIQVKWQDIPFEEFNLEDNRQKVVKKTLTKDGYEVVLEFAKVAPASRGIEAPITDERFALFLRDTDFIKPSDPAIQRQITEIKGDEKDAFAIIQNILKWISANIKQDIIAETLTGPEVLKKKCGKCAEYTTLFASLARAAGIPTKVAMGEVGMGNIWVGHGWNEVWLGDWMTVDAMQGIFVTGPSVIKFVDSPTLMGTQYVRNRLVDNLSLEILDFTEEQTVSSTEITTGIVDNTYSNKEFACRISAPKTGWIISETTMDSIPIITIQPKKEKAVTFHFMLCPVPPGTSPKTALDARANVRGGMLKNLKKVEEGEIEIAGRKVPRMVYQHDTKENLTLMAEESMLVDGANGYFFSFDAPKARFGELSKTVKKIYESFELVK